MQTCVRSLTKPALLLDHIRRPDTSNEAAAVRLRLRRRCGRSAASIHTSCTTRCTPRPRSWGLDPNQFYIKAAIIGVVTGAAAYLLCVTFASRMYFAMVSTELKNAAPRVLLHNMFCYSMGPSLLAPIPVAGPPLALLFIFLMWCVGGGKRLFISWRGTIVAAVLSMLLVLVIAGVGGYVLNMVLNNMLGLIEPPDVGEAEKPAWKRGE